VHTLKHVSRRVCFRVNAGCVGVCVNVAYLVGVGVLCQRVLVLLTLCLPPTQHTHQSRQSRQSHQSHQSQISPLISLTRLGVGLPGAPVVFFRPAHEGFLEAVWGFPPLADVRLSQLVN
jgi:hypothetical protein